MADKHEFTMQETQKIKNYLTRQSTDICRMNGCTVDEHKCESYAYIRHDGVILDVCASDYFQGCSSAYAGIPLPFVGSCHELREEIEEQCFELADVE